MELAQQWSRYRASPTAWVTRFGRNGGFVLAVYLVFAVALEHRAIAHLDSVCACNGGADPTQFMWALVWWPHAIVHGLNPFITHEIWASKAGFNLAGGTSIPGAALLAAPITALVGPVASFNIISTLAPAVSAWFAYALCRYITGAPLASMLGGLLYGFSSYELAHLLGLMHTTLVFVPPAAVLLTLKRLDQRIPTRRYVVLMTILLCLQLLLSAELFLTMTCLGVVTLVAGWAFAPAETRARLRALALPLIGAYGVAAVICSPFLYYAFQTPGYSRGWGQIFSADLLNFLVPTPITRLGGHRFASVAATFSGDPAEIGAYLGLPLVLIVCAWVAQWWKRPIGKTLTVVLVVSVVWSLGAHLWVHGHRTIPLPWAALDGLPLFDQLLPVRIAVFTALITAVIAALWLAAAPRRSWPRWALALLAVLFLIPNTAAAYPGTRVSFFHQPIPVPRLFASDLYKRYLHRGEVVLPIPYGPAGSSLLWQAKTDMYFRLASGYFGNPPPGYAANPVVAQLLANAPTSQSAPLLRAFIAQHGVQAIVADPAKAGSWPRVLDALGLHAMPVGGVLVYTA